MTEPAPESTPQPAGQSLPNTSGTQHLSSIPGQAATRVIGTNIPTPMMEASFTSTSTTSLRYGPLPEPEDLAGYAKVDPSFPDRMMRMAESEQAHRHAMNLAAIDAQREFDRADVATRRFQLGLGALVSCVFGGIACVLGLYGQAWLAAIIGGSTLLGIVAAILGKRRDKDDDEDDDEAKVAPPEPPSPRVTR